MKTRLRSILERVFSYGATVLAVLGGLYFLTHVESSQKETLNQKRQERLDVETKLADAKKEYDQRRVKVDKISKDLAAYQAEVKDKFDRLLQESRMYTDFIRKVESKAQAFEITIQNSKYDPPKPLVGGPAAYQEFQFTLSITGFYEKMKNFLWELEHGLGCLAKVTNIIITPPICDVNGRMALQITLTTFFRPNEGTKP